MRLALIDRIELLEPDSAIRAVKSLSLGEEYLQDHFPQFPVMPGVLMIEAMYQASMWLVRVTDDFSHSVVVLKEARNVRYSGFVRPGQTLVVSATIQKRCDNLTTLKALGQIDGKSVLNAMLTLNQWNLADKDPTNASIDRLLVEKQKRYWNSVFSHTRGTAELKGVEA